MTKLNTLYSVCAIALGSLVSSTAFAVLGGPQSGTIDFTGNIVESTCEVDAASLNQTVDLGVNIVRTAFTGVGTTSTAVPFTLTLSDCYAADNVSIKLSAVDPVGADKIAVAGGAAGVVIGIEHAGSPVVWGIDLPVATADATGVVNFDFDAAYYQTAATVVGGGANATATFEITYP